MVDKFAEGKTAGKVEIAITMLKDNESFDKISRFTGLPQDDIMKLKKAVYLEQHKSLFTKQAI